MCCRARRQAPWIGGLAEAAAVSIFPGEKTSHTIWLLCACSNGARANLVKSSILDADQAAFRTSWLNLTMRTILVLAGGSKTDEQVFATALAAAKPLGANLEFFHVRIASSEAARNTPYVDFARGAAISAALQAIDREVAARSASALRHFKAFCAREGIPLASGPAGVSSRVVSACWSEEQPEDAASAVMLHARHNELTVVGRARSSNGMPPGLVERLILESGRPVLIAPADLQRRASGTAVVCWKETPEAARALAVATPLLKASRHVVILNAEEGRDSRPESGDGLAARLKWSEIQATTRWLAADGRPAEQRLCQAVAELNPDLVIMGAYGHSRVRESILGGCTRQFLEERDRPVLLMH